MLFDCQISSVELFSTIQMPELKILSLCNNYICSVKAIRKAACTQIAELRICTSSLHLDGNYVMDAHTLSEAYFPALLCYHMDKIRETPFTGHIPDPRNLIKLQTQSLYLVGFYST